MNKLNMLNLNIHMYNIFKLPAHKSALIHDIVWLFCQCDRKGICCLCLSNQIGTHLFLSDKVCQYRTFILKFYNTTSVEYDVG